MPPVAIVWPCPFAVDAYAAAGRDLGSRARTARRVPGRWCSGRGTGVMSREAGRYWKIFVPRLRCARCWVNHALLPAFTLAWRLDVAETIDSVVGEVVAGGGCGVRPAAERAGVPYTTARGWVRRFRARAAELGVAFAAVELGGQAVTPPAGAGRFRANCDRRRVRRGREPAGMGPAGRVAVRLSGDRRQADRRQAVSGCPVLPGRRARPPTTLPGGCRRASPPASRPRPGLRRSCAAGAARAGCA